MSETMEKSKERLVEVVYIAERLQLLFDKILNHFEGEEINKADLRVIFDKEVDQLHTLSESKSAKLNKDLDTAEILLQNPHVRTLYTNEPFTYKEDSNETIHTMQLRDT